MYSALKKALCVLLCLASIAVFTGCGESKQYQQQVYAMDTVITLTAYGKNAEAGLVTAEATIHAIDSMADPDIETSACYALNHAQGSQVNISGQVAEMLIDAKDIYEKTDGAYDITIYPLLERWGFTNGKYYVPSPEEISEDLARLCMGSVTISKFPTSGTYAVSMPSYGELSFASCARGCAAKYAVDAMKKAGVESGLVSMTGAVQTLGLKTDGSLWTVGIADPKSPSGYLGTVSVGETSVSTSGSYQDFVPGNEKYHHLLSTSSGYPSVGSLLAATVICEDGTLADCLSTAMFVLGQSKAINYWRTHGGFEMVLITDSGEIICTSGLLERFDVTNHNYTLRYVE